MGKDTEVSELLWALKILGVDYDPPTKVFRVPGNRRPYVSPVHAAEYRRTAIREAEVKGNRLVPQMAEAMLGEIKKDLRGLKASNTTAWRKNVEDKLDDYTFRLRKVANQSPSDFEVGDSVL